MGDGATSFMVRASAGSLLLEDGVRVPHAWTPEGVRADTAGSGAHFFHLAIALCILNDTYREAQGLGIPVNGVEVTADGGFDEHWVSTGVTYRIRIDSPADPAVLAELRNVVDDVAEVPKTVRAGAAVRRVST